MAIGTVFSDALETQAGSGATPAPANLSRSKLIVAPFIWTAAAEASGTVVNVTVLPKGARLISGNLIASASFGSTQISVGISGKDNNGYYDDASVAGLKTDASAVTAGTPVADSAAGFKAAATITTTKLPFLATIALGYLYEVQKECYLTLTTSAATAGTDVIRGEVVYAVD